MVGRPGDCTLLHVHNGDRGAHKAKGISVRQSGHDIDMREYSRSGRAGQGK